MRDWLVLGVLALAVGACGPGSRGLREDSEARADCNSAAARIQALIAQGQFAEAEVLIAESSAAGLLAKPQATELLRRIAQLNTKLGNFPHASSGQRTSPRSSRTTRCIRSRR